MKSVSIIGSEIIGQAYSDTSCTKNGSFDIFFLFIIGGFGDICRIIGFDGIPALDVKDNVFIKKLIEISHFDRRYLEDKEPHY